MILRAKIRRNGTESAGEWITIGEGYSRHIGFSEQMTAAKAKLKDFPAEILDVQKVAERKLKKEARYFPSDDEMQGILFPAKSEPGADDMAGEGEAPVESPAESPESVPEGSDDAEGADVQRVTGDGAEGCKGTVHEGAGKATQGPLKDRLTRKMAERADERKVGSQARMVSGPSGEESRYQNPEDRDLENGEVEGFKDLARADRIWIARKLEEADLKEAHSKAMKAMKDKVTAAEDLIKTAMANIDKTALNRPLPFPAKTRTQAEEEKPESQPEPEESKEEEKTPEPDKAEKVNVCGKCEGKGRVPTPTENYPDLTGECEQCEGSGAVAIRSEPESEQDPVNEEPATVNEEPEPVNETASDEEEEEKEEQAAEDPANN